MNKIIVVCLLFLFQHMHGQIKFADKTSQYKGNQGHYSGIAGGTIDVNGDFYDDIIILDKSRFISVAYNTGASNTMVFSNQITAAPIAEYSIIGGDIDNDGHAEIVCGGGFTGTKIYTTNQNGDLLPKANVNNPSIYTQATNMIDINQDGWLDYFACHDEGANLTLINDKAGNLKVSPMIDFTTIPASDMSGNYGSEWCDVDNDGDADLYLAKCKFGVSDLEDPRRHNMLFINNNGSFVNEAEARGLKDKGQSWTGSFADIDNDGDMDCIVTNHDAPHRFYINDGKGYFTPGPTGLNLNSSFAFQSLWADFDNNGFIDLLLTGGDKSYIYFNQGNLKFNIVDNLLGNFIVNSATLGDYNNDGFNDMTVYYGTGINLPGYVADRILINEGNGNNHLKIGLKGVQSNINGIGTRLTLYGQWGVQCREVYSGVSYGVSNSLNQIFGLGSFSKADSLIIRWPSGKVDKYYNLSANQFLIANEGRCIKPLSKISSSKNDICPNESMDLLINANDAKNVVWNNGGQTQSITIDKPGLYNAHFTDNQGCEQYTELKTIVNSNLTSIFSPVVNDVLYYCENLSITPPNSIKNIIWNDNLAASTYMTQESGVVTVTGKNQCGTTIFDTLAIQNVGKIKIVNDTVPKGGVADLYAFGKNIKWYNKEGNFIQNGSNLTIANLQSTTTYTVKSIDTAGIQKFTLGEKTIPSPPNYPSDNKDVGLYLTTYQPVLLRSFETFSEFEGNRRFVLYDKNGDTLFNKLVFIPKNALTKIEVNVKIPPQTEYILKTDEVTNIEVFGTKSPKLVKSESTDTKYPYIINGLIEIPVSLRGATEYFYFYNIQVEDFGTICEQQEAVTAYLDKDVSTTIPEDNGVLVYPNPAYDVITIKCNDKSKFTLYTTQGSKVMEMTLTNGSHNIEITSLVTGTYIAQITNDRGVKKQKVIISH